MSLVDGFDDAVAEGLAEWSMPGAAVAVAHRGEVVYLKGHGVRAVGSDERVDPDTLFQIGSTTKAFTATALGLLVDDGRVGWDDPIVRHLPEFQLSDPGLTREVTLRDAVSHRAGFVDNFAPSVEILTPTEMISRMRCVTTFDAYRRSYRYSNMMYGVLGEVVARVSGLPWGDFVRARLFEPLDMSRSRASPREVWDRRDVAPCIFGSAPGGVPDPARARATNLAMPHSFVDGAPRPIAWQDYAAMAGAGNLVSSARDMARWLQVQLFGDPIVAPGTLAEIHGAQNPYAVSQVPLDADTGAHAMGWRRDRYRGQLHLSHGGLILGFPAYVAFLPDHGVGIVVLANGQDADMQAYAMGYHPMAFHKALALRLFDRLLGEADGRWSLVRPHMLEVRRRYLGLGRREAAERAGGPSPTWARSEYVGRYEERTGIHGPLTIEAIDGVLVLAFDGEGAYRARMEPCGRRRFRLRPQGPPYLAPRIRFSPRPDGGPDEMEAFGARFRRVG